jgi:hypothetical protein
LSQIKSMGIIAACMSAKACKALSHATVLQINRPNQSTSCQAFRHRLWRFSTFRHRNRPDDVSASTRQFTTWLSHLPPDMMAET